MESIGRENDAELFPFTFEMPDGKLRNDMVFLNKTQIQLTGFAQNIKYYQDVKAFRAPQKNDFKLPVQFYASPDVNDEYQHSKPYGTFIGTIANFKLCENPVSKEKLYWILVNTYIGQLDVVAAIGLFKNQLAL